MGLGEKRDRGKAGAMPHAQWGTWRRFRVHSSSQPKASNPRLRNPNDTTSKNNPIPLRIQFISFGSEATHHTHSQMKMATGEVWKQDFLKFINY